MNKKVKSKMSSSSSKWRLYNSQKRRLFQTWVREKRLVTSIFSFSKYVFEIASSGSLKIWNYVSKGKKHRKNANEAAKNIKSL